MNNKKLDGIRANSYLTQDGKELLIKDRSLGLTDIVLEAMGAVPNGIVSLPLINSDH